MYRRPKAGRHGTADSWATGRQGGGSNDPKEEGIVLRPSDGRNL